MAAEGAGRSKLAELVADHILGNVHGHMTAAVVDGDGVSDDFSSSGAAKGPFLMLLLMDTFPPYFALRRLTMNLSVRFFVLRVL